MLKSFLLTIILANLMSISAFAAAPSDLVLSAKAVKAIYDKGFTLSQIVDVSFAEQLSNPPKLCVMVVYERRPNTVCPDSPIGPNFDKGYAACLNSSTNEVESVMPVLSDESGCY